MSMHGAPLLPHSCLDRGTRSPSTDSEINGMRATAWHRHDVAALLVADITDHWLRHAITNEANRRLGRRSPGRTTMAVKRKRKAAKPKQDDLSKPSKWRLQHGGFSAPAREADPETGTPVEHRRAVDTLGLMLANGTITPQMHEAGGIFRTLFRSAALDGIATSQLIRLAGATGDAMSSRQIDARRRVANAIHALGGHDSPAGSCAWFVIGLEFSVREWAMRQGWSGRPVHGPVAQGILVGALGTLAMHFGLVPRQRVA